MPYPYVENNLLYLNSKSRGSRVNGNTVKKYPIYFQKN